MRGDHRDLHDVFRLAAARKVVGGFGEPLQNGPDGFAPAEALRQLVTDIAGVQVREDQHIRASRHRRTRRLARADFRNQGGVKLELAVHGKFAARAA